MNLSRYLLWIDGSGAAIVGIAVLAFSEWLSEWHRLPRGFLIFLGAANLAYACYSLPLARRSRRPRALILLLVAANSTWAVACMIWAFVFYDTASIFGLAHLLGEGLYVGGLACLEWHWREQLLTA